MSVEATGAVAPEPTMEPQAVERPDVAKPSGLHSPPDSNNARTLDGSDSELSDLEDDAVAGRFKQEAEAANAPDPAPVVEDIGDVFPDHWSGTVPVFRPNMKQFKDFKLFVRLFAAHSRRDAPELSADPAFRCKKSTSTA